MEFSAFTHNSSFNNCLCLTVASVLCPEQKKGEDEVISDSELSDPRLPYHSHCCKTFSTQSLISHCHLTLTQAPCTTCLVSEPSGCGKMQLKSTSLEKGLLLRCLLNTGYRCKEIWRETCLARLMNRNRRRHFPLCFL